MPVKSLMIACVESQYTQEYIANVFWRQYIAKVSSITLIPYIKDSEIYNIAYITISEWCDSESAFNFIKRLRDSESEALLVHHSDNWWPVKLNTHNNGEMNVGDYTVTFDSTYFEKSIGLDIEICSDDILIHRPIKGIRNEYYSVDEAIERIWLLKQKSHQSYLHKLTVDDIDDIEFEISHLNRELLIHEAVNKSSNVTLRDYQFRKQKLEEKFCTWRMPTTFKRKAIGEWYEHEPMTDDVNSCEVSNNYNEMFA